MKKSFILITVFAAASAIFFSAESISAQSRTSVSGGVIGTAGNGATYDLSLRRAFSVPPSQESFGRDLYKNIYQRVKNEGNDLTINRVAGSRNLSREELSFMIPGLDINQLIAKESGAELTADETTERQKDLISEVEAEKMLADLEVALKMEVEAAELFANGDENDSGFDLIVDLDVIDMLLFGREEMAPGGGDSTAGGTGDGGAIGSRSNPSQSGGSPRSGATISGGSAQNPQTASRSQGVSSSAGGGHGENGQGVCAINNSFNAAVEQAREQERNRQNAQPSGASPAAERALSSGQDAGQAGGSRTGADTFAARLQSSQIGGNNFCIGEDGSPATFCLRFEAVYKKKSSYTNADNCIACHFEKINDAFKKTFEHSLIPSKATGNIMEASKCKVGIGSLKWNLVMLPQPILTPPNDDLLMKADFMKNLYDFCKKVSNGEVFSRIGSTGESAYVDRCDWLYGPDRNEIRAEDLQMGPGEAEKLTQSALENLPSSTNPSTVIEEINKKIAEKEKEREKETKLHALTGDALSQAMQFDVLSVEIEKMNEYFDGFVKLFNDLTSQQADTPCQILRSKPTCQ